jgi:hypothetical protein
MANDRSALFWMPPKYGDSHPDAEALLDLALEHARGSMKEKGRLAPTLIARTPRGLLAFVAGSVDTDEDKDRFANQARLILVGHRATGCVLIMEVWAAMARDGKLAKGAPSKHPERTEAVCIAVETPEQKMWQLLPIRRDAASRFIEFALSLVPEGAEMTGRFSELLPPNAPSAESARVALVLAEAAGVRAVAADTNAPETRWD